MEDSTPLTLDLVNDGRRFIVRRGVDALFVRETPPTGFIDHAIAEIEIETGDVAPVEFESILWDAAFELERKRWTLPGRTAAELLEATEATPDSFVDGFLIRGWMTKLAAREKVGKGTLAFYLFGRLERDEETVFGPAYGRPVTSLLLTEEPPESVREKVEQFGLERSRIIYGHELAGLTWAQKVEQLVNIAMLERHEIVFLDNISRSTGVEDEAGPELARAIEVLMDALRAERLTGIIDHHHKKGAGKTEDKSRGSTAIAGATDINVEMFREGNGRARKLIATGRLSATCWTRTIELAEERTNFVVSTAKADKTQQEQDAALLADQFRLRSLDGGRGTVHDFAAALHDGRRFDAQSKQYKDAERRLKRLLSETPPLAAIADERGEKNAVVYVAT